MSRKNFWVVDLQTDAERQLGELAQDTMIGDFDVSRKGEEIVFDRVEESSQIARWHCSRRDWRSAHWDIGHKS
jgi:hypothetical protein